MRDPVPLALALSAAGFLVAGLDAAAIALDLPLTYTATWEGDALLLGPRDVLEMAGITLATAGALVLGSRLAKERDRLPRTLVAGVFLLAAGGLLRVLYYALTLAMAPALLDESGALTSWVESWHSTAVAVATGAALVGAALAPPRSRLAAALVAGAAALAFVAATLVRGEAGWGLALLRDAGLLGLAAVLGLAAARTRRDPRAVYE